MVFVVETSERGGDFATRKIFSLKMVHFGAFSVATETAVPGTRPPDKYHSGYITQMSNAIKSSLLLVSV